MKQPALPVEVNINGLSATAVTLTEYRIDDEHSNSYEVWKKMGSPQNPTKERQPVIRNEGKNK